jgi:uncharacterized linocin/CFP29 family protein
MDVLKRNLAPISDGVWNEIDERAKEVFESYLSARRIVGLKGPLGLNYTVVPEGRVGPHDEKDGVKYGMYRVKPLVELRVEFELDRWELDNLERGAVDLELGALEEAVKKAALFEENVIYNSLEDAQIIGLQEASENEPIEMGESTSDIMEAVTDGLLKLKESFVGDNYVLVVGPKVWKKINKLSDNYPLMRKLEETIGNKVMFSHVLEGALLLPVDHDDLEMTIGRDFSIGYHSSTDEKVKFYIMETFTFRVLDPSIIVKFK